MHLVDFAILSGMLEEFEVIRALMPGLRRVEGEDSPFWYRTQIPAGENNYEIVAGHGDGQGPLEAAALTNAVIQRWKPAQIVLVGIAGSMDKDVRLGDVVVSQQVYYYSPAKATAEGFKHRPEGYPCSVSLLRQLEALRAEPEEYAAWRQDAASTAARLAIQNGVASLSEEQARAAGEALPSHRPQIHFGALASGHLVVASDNMKKALLALHGKLLATEMEGAGVLHSAYYREPTVRAIVVKGISDAANPDKSAEDARGLWRTAAKSNSVVTALHLIRSGRIAPVGTNQFELNALAGTRAEACDVLKEGSVAGRSYLAFPRLVLPRGPLTTLTIRVQVRGRENSVGVMQFVARYLDEFLERSEATQSGDAAVVISRTVARAPVGVYLLLDGTPTEIVFTASTELATATASWKPGPLSQLS